MEENVSRVSDLVMRLISHSFPPNTDESITHRVHAYLLRILSSRMGSSIIDDETTLRQLMQKRIQKRAEAENIAKHTTNSLSLRLQELMQKLSKNKVMHNKWSIYYLLYKVSEQNDSKQGATISPLEAIFKARELEKKKNPNDTTIQKGRMDIEGSLSTTVNTIATNKRREGKSEEQSTLKLVQKIANKGNPSIDLSESDLLRDILFSFQGIDGNYVSYSKHEDSFVIKPTVSLSEPVKKMVCQLCELGWLYKRVQTFLQDETDKGLIYQSLCYAIKEELNEYYRFIAILENLRDSEDEQSRSSYLVEEDQSLKSLNLRKLYLWSIEPFERLKWISILGDACKNARGCVLLSIINSYSKQGSPSIQVLINRILKDVLTPLSNFIKQWVYFGELNDPYGEFFVSVNSLVKDDQLWQDKYKLNINLIPNFIDQQLAEKILLTGKSVNFMRRCCAVNNWVLDIEFIDMASAVVSSFNQISKFTEFKDWVNKATEITSKKLLNVLSSKFRLSEHFYAIKRFLLFGQGDFIQYLMEILTNELSKPAASIYKHNMLSLLETAIRASNAQYIDQEFLTRLDIKLLDPSPGDNGWDIFTLSYKVESPITTILSPKIMTDYLRLFNFLWRVKRVEYSLSSIWTQHMKSARMIEKMREFKSHIHKCNILRHEMNHFLSNFLNYIMVEVIEGAWKNFTDQVREAKDLNEVIKYHESFVASILDKALLKGKNEKIYKQLIKTFDFIMRFKHTQEILFTSAQEEYQRKIATKKRKDMMQLLEDDQESNADDGQSDHANNIITAEAFNHLQIIWKDYKENFNELMSLLKDEELASKLRFLSFRLDFNEFYSENPKSLKQKYNNIEEFKKMTSYSGATLTKSAKDNRPPFPPSQSSGGGNIGGYNITTLSSITRNNYIQPQPEEKKYKNERIVPEDSHHDDDDEEMGDDGQEDQEDQVDYDEEEPEREEDEEDEDYDTSKYKKPESSISKITNNSGFSGVTGLSVLASNPKNQPDATSKNDLLSALKMFDRVHGEKSTLSMDEVGNFKKLISLTDKTSRPQDSKFLDFKDISSIRSKYEDKSKDQHGDDFE